MSIQKAALAAIMVLGALFMVAHSTASSDVHRAEASPVESHVGVTTFVASSLSCTLTDQFGNQVCVTVTQGVGGTNNTQVTIAPCGTPLVTGSTVPSDTKRRVASDCYGEFYWTVAPDVNWGTVTSCDELNIFRNDCT